MVEAQAPVEEVENEEGEQVAKKIKLNDRDDLDEKIRKQVDYYFSDVNVIKDKFMKEQFKENDGWVQLSVLNKFARLNEMSKFPERIAEALKGHESEVIEFDEQLHRVRRKKPMPDEKSIEDLQKKLDSRTVHISGFPTDFTFESLRRFCSEYGEVESLSMRRFFKSKFFKGCIHVVFKNEADAKKIMETDPLKCKDRELRTENMEAYHKRKAEMKEKRKAKAAKTAKS